MFDRLYRMAILGLLQLSIVLGIVLLPVAYLSRGVGSGCRSDDWWRR